MSDSPSNTEFFSETEINFALVECRQSMKPNERISNFIASVFETAPDGVIEWYEFLDFLLVLQTVPATKYRRASHEVRSKTRGEAPMVV